MLGGFDVSGGHWSPLHLLARLLQNRIWSTTHLAFGSEEGELSDQKIGGGGGLSDNDNNDHLIREPNSGSSVTRRRHRANQINQMGRKDLVSRRTSRCVLGCSLGVAPAEEASGSRGPPEIPDDTSNLHLLRLQRVRVVASMNLECLGHSSFLSWQEATTSR
jgi:hypothetical protein